ncbi:double-strand break repair helicase AddA [Caulobacter vibrioides]|uniref:double-strand break repair helicase AddA n=1 Tax=Caulobacter vibrioides TaxID=155892 RepID=UPI000BB488B8|nr:double-strand break repair helicase AddA [Caulobacter vibrioides]ATC26397.1 double-strand break repair helicase AddA [Caulobacter vibrioides]AZH14527.1 double-strand break repair helicase AddA [Caulobacter vibrioides]PLR12219.1 double-strand break repair helicase AddA [Caulobacter vibrioides]
MHDPQRIAADPTISAFVTANAGSGKTKTLIDRVARLLLAGVEPQAILCVTYTKAAAAEMQRRLFDRLGKWSVTSDADLRAELVKLVGEADARYDAKSLSDARALFAKALETPGGLKIQTIHAFCEKLLRRFPLEAGVSPGFTVMDDQAGAAIARAARRAVAAWVDSHDDAFSEAYARFSVALDFQSFEAMFAGFEARRGQIMTYVQRCGGLAVAVSDAWRRCGFDGPTSAQDLAVRAMARLDLPAWRAAATVLFDGGGKQDAKSAEALAAVARDPEATLDVALRALFTEGGEGTPATWPAKTSGLKSREDLREALLLEQAKLEAAREQVRAARVAEDTQNALLLAGLYIERHMAEKEARGALDFTDLIDKTRLLLTEKVEAAWVLYKLDGGIDHILLDEAQDTAPEQWEILRALTADFFVGETSEGWSGRRAERTLFVVGDEKQSIYSFQGADPTRLLEETQGYISRIEAVGAVGKGVPLTVSYRSTHQVLSFVDALFSDPDTREGVPPPVGQDLVRHELFRHGHPGCVDLWPLTRELPGEDREAWEKPLDEEGERSANRRLAEAIAAETRAILDRGDAVFDKDMGRHRAAHAGDILVLVRRRKALFEEIIRALKRRGVPVAGADRLALSSHIAFEDLVALGRFILFPDDDLTLAALLKTPFCGLGDDDVYALAKGRRGTLWAELTRRSEERPEWAAARAVLDWALAEGRRRQPFEFYAGWLGLTDADGRSHRAKVLTRLGAEAEEALDEFLAQVMEAEQRGVRDLEALVADFAALDIIVKREMEGARREVRVMTAHGSKGLEAPIVFLPETTVKRGAGGSPLLVTEDGALLWCASGKGDCAASAKARKLREDKEAQEALRLLYVALTRARERLILCGRIDARTKDDKVGGWYAAARAAFAHPDIAPGVRTIGDGETAFLRYGPDPLGAPRVAPATAAVAAPPAWIMAQATPEPAAARYAAPSRLEDTARVPAPSPLARIAGLGRYRRGELIHKLLQLLPDLPPAQRPDAARRILAAERDLTDTQRTEMASAAFGVLEDARFAAVFGPNSRAEVALAGTSVHLPQGLAVSGRVDRLVVDDARVLVVDYKTNRPSPDRIEDADTAYLAQMAVYAAVLREVFPGRTVEAALVWTDGPKLMPVPEKVMALALARLA